MSVSTRLHTNSSWFFIFNLKKWKFNTILLFAVGIIRLRIFLHLSHFEISIFGVSVFKMIKRNLQLSDMKYRLFYFDTHSYTNTRVLIIHFLYIKPVFGYHFLCTKIKMHANSYDDLFRLVTKKRIQVWIGSHILVAKESQKASKQSLNHLILVLFQDEYTKWHLHSRNGTNANANSLNNRQDDEAISCLHWSFCVWSFALFHVLLWY